MAIVRDARDNVLGFWDITEPWIAAMFEDADEAYFEAEVDGERIELLSAVPDPGWPD